MDKLQALYDWVTQSTKHKVIAAVSLFVLVEGAVYIVRKRQLRRQAEKNPKKDLEVVDRSYIMEDLAKEPSTSYERENPLLGHSQEVIKLFLEKLRASNSLSAFYKPEQLQPDSSYAKNLEIHVMNAMGGPYREFEVNLKKVHKGMKITRENYREWVSLWMECEKQLGLVSKDIWGELEEEVVY